MCFEKCKCLAEIILGAILGIIVGYLAFTTVIPGIITALWIAFGIAGFAILTLIVLAIAKNRRIAECICDNGACLLAGAVLTILMAIILLSIPVVIGSLLIAVLIGLATMFLTITLVALSNLILCLVNSACECKE